MAKKRSTKKLTTNARQRQLAVESQAIFNAREMALNDFSIFRNSMLKRMLDPRRDLDSECGWTETPELDHFARLYEREGVARRVVHVLPEEAWATPPMLIETEDSKKTAFEGRWEEVEQIRNVDAYMERLDILSGLGRFAVMLIGVDDGQNLDRPIEGVQGYMRTKRGTKAAAKKEREVTYLRVFDERFVTINKWEADIRSPRYGQPTEYTITMAEVSVPGLSPDKSQVAKGVQVHWSRIIHVADNCVESEWLGTPRMLPVYNRLLDIRKVAGGSAEMFWRGAAPGLSLETDPSKVAGMDTEAVKEEAYNYQNGLDRVIALHGVSAKMLSVQVADPTPHVTLQLKLIALTIGIPWRVFVGSEEAKLAGDADTRTWAGRLTRRREKHVSPNIVRAVVDRFIEIGVVPPPQEYTVKWPDMLAPSEHDKAETAKVQTEAMKAYVQGGVDSIIPPKEQLVEVMGWDPDKAETVIAAALKHEEDQVESSIARRDKLIKAGLMPDASEGRIDEGNEGEEENA